MRHEGGDADLSLKTTGGDLAAAQRVFDTASAAIDALKGAVGEAFVAAVDVLFKVRGRVIVSGMGKSGHIGRKIAATLASTGTPAHFVHPAEASHGDMGEVTGDDAILMLSWGGETAELFDLIGYAKQLGIPLIGMAGNRQSMLIKAADVALVLPKVTEACPMGKAPTTSTTLMLVMGDALAVALMERRGFDEERYRNYHPGGSLGRSMMRVVDLMRHKGLPLAAPTDTVEAALNTMSAGRLGCVGVVDANGALIGIVTDGDVRRNFGRARDGVTMGEIMTKTPKVVAPLLTASAALDLMRSCHITQLFVLDPEDASGRPCGVLHIHDCLMAGLK